MKIAYICNPSSGHEAKWISYFAEKYQVIIICSEAYTDLHPTIAHVPVYKILPQTYPLLNWPGRARTVKKVKKLLAQQEISVVHAMYAVPNAFWAWHTSDNYLVTTRGSDLLQDYQVLFHEPGGLLKQLRNWFLRRITRNSLQQASYITSTSQLQQGVIRTFIKSEDKLKLIRTGVDSQVFNNPVEYQGELGSGPLLFCPRSMLPIYNIHLLVVVVAQLKASYPDLRLCLLNDKPEGEYVDRVKKTIEQYHLESSVELMAKQTVEGMVALYQQADLVIMMPQSDGTPNSGIETMLMKRPLVLPNLPYDKDIFNNQTAWFAKGNNVRSVVDTLTKVIELSASERKKKVDQAYVTASMNANLQVEREKTQALYRAMV